MPPNAPLKPKFSPPDPPDPPEPMNGPPTLTKTKTQSKVLIATGVIIMGLGLLAAAAAVRRASQVCDSGSQRGVSCNTHRNCRTAPDDAGALCVRTADLMVRSVTFDPTTRLPTVTVVNQGTATVTWTGTIPPQIGILWLNADNESLTRPGAGSDISGPIPALAPGATNRLVFTPPTIAPAAAAGIRVILDHDNRVLESSEDNNVWEGNLPLADLIVHEVQFGASGLAFRVQNRGNAAVSRFTLQYRWHTPDRVYLDEGVSVTQDAVFMPGASLDNFGMSEPSVAEYLANAPADASQLELWIDPQNEVIESSEINNSTMVARPFPDLTVDSIVFDQTWGYAIPTIRNQGSANAGTFMVRREWLNAEGELTGQAMSWEVQELAVGASAAVIVSDISREHLEDRFLPPLEAVSARVTVDANSQVAELNNEDNNVLVVLRPLPDLIVQSVNFDPTTRVPTEIVLSNQGTGPALWLGAIPPQVVVKWLNQNGQPIGAATRNAILLTPLRAGATHTPPLPRFIVPSAAVRLRVTVDAGQNRVGESNEDNNVWEGEIPPPPLPDLTVQSVTFDPTTRLPTVVVANQGAATVAWTGTIPPQIGILWLNADNESLTRPGAGSDISGPIPALAPGATNRLVFTPPTIAPAAAAGIRVTVDSRSIVIEFNEDNNIWQGTMPPLP